MTAVDTHDMKSAYDVGPGKSAADGGLPHEPVEIEIPVPERLASAGASPAQVIPTSVPPASGASFHLSPASSASREWSGIPRSASDATGTARVPAGEPLPPRSASGPDHPRMPGFGKFLGSYEPGLPLVKKVSVYAWHTTYNYYDAFLSAAEKLSGVTSEEAEYRPFFSYMPQYSQLDRDQLAYYLKIRDGIASGETPRADYGYILLLIYELINLGGRRREDGEYYVSPTEALGMLVDIWKGYRGDNPRLDDQLTEWICDFCLIHRLAPPLARMGPVMADVIRRARLREFYLDPMSGGDFFVDYLLYFVSGYDFRKSRFASADAETLRFYTEHMRGMLCEVLKKAGADTSGSLTRRTAVRDAYIGALCHPSVKRKITVEYLSYSASVETKMLLSNTIKYAENRLRQSFGVRSKLSHGKLPDAAAAAVDAYFDEKLPSAGKHREAPPEDDYESKYDRPYAPADVGSAARIEESSWAVTDILTSAFADGPVSTGHRAAPEESTAAAGNQNEASVELKDLPAGQAEASGEKAAAAGDQNEVSVEREELPAGQGEASGEQNVAAGKQDSAVDGKTARAVIDFVAAAAAGDRAAQKRAADAAGMLPDALAEKINAAAYDITGDVLLYSAGQMWRVIDEYEADAVRTAGLIAKGDEGNAK